MRFLQIFYLILCVNFAYAQDPQYQLHEADTDSLIGASTTCLNAYNANVSCSDTIGLLNGDLFPDLSITDLGLFCTTTCYTSLLAHRAGVAQSCPASVQYFDLARGSYYLVTAMDDRALYSYNLTCLTRSDGQYCNTWFQTQANSSAPDGTACDDCILKTLQQRVSSPFEIEDTGIQSVFQSLTTSCSKTGYATSTATAVYISSTPTATSSCTGSVYQVSSSDSFYSVPVAQNVATQQLLTTNGLSYNVSDFPKTGTLCVQNQCTVHVIALDETCEGIAGAGNISYAQLTSWNMNINGLCTNLNTMVNQTLCLSNPLGDFQMPTNTNTAPVVAITAAPRPTNVGLNTSSDCGKYYLVIAGDECATIALKFSIPLKEFYFLNPSVNSTDCHDLLGAVYYCVQSVGDINNYPGYDGAPILPPFSPQNATEIVFSDLFSASNRTDIEIVPLADGSRTDCFGYYWTDDLTAADCWAVAAFNGLDPETFVLFNPSLDQNPADVATKTFNYTCTISTSASYCYAIASPTPIPTTVPEPPKPRAGGEVADCTTWKIATALDCADQLSNIRLSLAMFYAMNPSVNADCSGLVLGTYYCVSEDADGFIGEYPTDDDITSTSTSSATSTSSNLTPSPIQTGMVTNCGKFYLVVANDGCFDIAAAQGITLANFYAWNAALKGDCSGLQANVYVCVGLLTVSSTSGVTSTTSTSKGVTSTTGVSTPSPIQTGMTTSCNKFYGVISGDGCYDIAAANGIALTDFYTWNPALKGDCSGLQANVYVCVGVSASAPVTTTTSSKSTSTSAAPVVTPTPYPGNMLAGCTKFYYIVSGDDCSTVLPKFGLTVATFTTWNPDVGSACSLWLNYYYCVAH